MIDFLNEAGVVVWVMLAMGFGGIALAGYTVFHPTEQRIAVCESAQRALLFTMLGGFASGLAAMLRAGSIAVSDPKFQGQPDLAREIVFQGGSECLVNPIVGFSLLGIVALLTTVARMRSPAR